MTGPEDRFYPGRKTELSCSSRNVNYKSNVSTRSQIQSGTEASVDLWCRLSGKLSTVMKRDSVLLLSSFCSDRKKKCKIFCRRINNNSSENRNVITPNLFIPVRCFRLVPFSQVYLDFFYSSHGFLPSFSYPDPFSCTLLVTLTPQATPLSRLILHRLYEASHLLTPDQTPSLVATLNYP